MSMHIYRVEGMTCEHCARSIEHEVAQMPGVHAVVVDLAAATVAIESAEEVPLEQIAAAVDEAGYTLGGRA